MNYNTFSQGRSQPRNMSVPPIQSSFPVAGSVVDNEIGDPLGKGSAVKEYVRDSGPEDNDIPSANPFLDEATAEYWRQVYEESQYECRHVFDPHLTWTQEEEKRLIRKLDWRVCLWACCMFFGLQVDRGNLVQAVSDNMLDDLGLDTNGTTTPLLPTPDLPFGLRCLHPGADGVKCVL